jgi:PAS domain S-box-containing protein
MSDVPRILVVDDTEANRYTVARHLRKAGYRVTEAADGRRALEYVAQDVPDVMVLDIRMPDIDGLEVVRRIRADSRFAHLPIIHVSASFTDPESQAAGLDGGADGYLTHPVEPLVLLATVRALLRTRRAEREARAAVTAWRATFEAIGDGVCVLDQRGRIERCNAAFETIVGATEPRGQTLSELFPALATVSEPPFVALADGRPLLGTELTIQDRRVQVSARPMPEWEGGGRAVCVVTDVTRQRAAENRLQQAQRLEAAGQLAGGIAHEINNMMTVILGLTEFMNRSGQLSSSQQHDMAEIGKAAGRGADMARQLLAFTRRQILHPQLLDLNATLARMGRLVTQLMGADREVTLHLSPEAGLVFADEGQLEQVMLNLALNARDAMTAGGRFTIATAPERLEGEFAAVHPGVEIRPGDYARITVADTGSGMDPETLQRAFEPFFTTKPVGEGSGLGLSTVYGIVKQSNGYIWADSAPGAGTSFRIYLPQVNGLIGVAEPTDRPERLEGGTETILVVDDEPMVRALARRVLEMYGYSVREAGSGQSALEEISGDTESRIALAVVDVVMPGMNGRELGERLREARPRMPVVYMSGYTGDELSRRRLLLPSVPFLQKPFHPDELVERVQELLRLHARDAE